MRAGAPAVERIVAHYRLPIREDVVRNRASALAFVVDAATLYRGIAKGRYPRPIKIGPGLSRWLAAECQAALASMIEDLTTRR
jgi:predicted DNA-binding transcriptional regulator AlpA